MLRSDGAVNNNQGGTSLIAWPCEFHSLLSRLVCPQGFLHPGPARRLQEGVLGDISTSLSAEIGSRAQCGQTISFEDSAK